MCIYVMFYIYAILPLPLHFHHPSFSPIKSLSLCAIKFDKPMVFIFIYGTVFEK